MKIMRRIMQDKSEVFIRNVPTLLQSAVLLLRLI